MAWRRKAERGLLKMQIWLSGFALSETQTGGLWACFRVLVSWYICFHPWVEVFSIRLCGRDGGGECVWGYFNKVWRQVNNLRWQNALSHCRRLRCIAREDDVVVNQGDGVSHFYSVLVGCPADGEWHMKVCVRWYLCESLSYSSEEATLRAGGFRNRRLCWSKTVFKEILGIIHKYINIVSNEKFMFRFYSFYSLKCVGQ